MEERSLCWGRSTEERDRIMDTSRTRNVAIVLYDGVEILDFAGPYEVFAAAAHSEGHPFEVFTIADHTDLITSNAGLQLKPHHSFADHPPVDIIIAMLTPRAPIGPCGVLVLVAKRRATAHPIKA